MFYPRTERQERFIRLAEELAPLLEQRASDHDRDGSFTTTWGRTASEFDDTAKCLGFARCFGTPGRPQSASVHMERFWLSMRQVTNWWGR